MKSFIFVAILFFRTQAFSSDVNFSNNVLSDFLDEDFSGAKENQSSSQRQDKLLRETRRFKLALLACYAALISLFGSVVYCSILLDPKFPF